MLSGLFTTGGRQTTSAVRRVDHYRDSVPLYPGVKKEVDEKRYLHRVEKLHTHVLPLECGRARGVENRDFIREDRKVLGDDPLYPEIAEATDLGATLRSNIRESLPAENWEGTPLEALLRAAGIILGTPAVIALALVTWTRRKKRLA